MGRRQRFRYARPPRFSDWSPAIAMLLLAAALTGAALVAVADPEGRSGGLAGDLVILLVAAAAWWIAGLLAAGPWHRRSAFRSGEAAIEVDEAGLTLPGLTGKPVHVPWARVEAMELVLAEGRHLLAFRGGGVSGSVPLDDLDVPPAAAWEAIEPEWRRSRCGVTVT